MGIDAAFSSALELRLLGDFRLRLNGTTVGLTPRAEHLLAFLALRNDLRRTAVSAQLWPDLDEAQARGACGRRCGGCHGPTGSRWWQRPVTGSTWLPLCRSVAGMLGASA